MKIIILDTETTGGGQGDRICQLSFLVCNEELEIETIYNDLCTPPLPISFEAMAIHHITPEMLEGKETCHDNSLAANVALGGESQPTGAAGPRTCGRHGCPCS